MMLKKEMKMGGGRNVINDEAQEMNELIESEEEINAADLDEDDRNMHQEDDGIDGDNDDDQDFFDYYDADEKSLIDSDEERD